MICAPTLQFLTFKLICCSLIYLGKLSDGVHELSVLLFVMYQTSMATILYLSLYSVSTCPYMLFD